MLLGILNIIIWIRTFQDVFRTLLSGIIIYYSFLILNSMQYNLIMYTRIIYLRGEIREIYISSPLPSFF